MGWIQHIFNKEEEVKVWYTGGWVLMEKVSTRIGDCILCGSRVMDNSEFYETGEGYCHEFCMEVRNVAR